MPTAILTDSVRERYRSIRRLGEGGTAVVYQAVDTVLGRPVALKQLRPEHARSLLRHEGQSLARLRHPNVVALHDLVEGGDSTYLVLEYVEGWTLERLLTERGPLSLEQALRVTAAVGDALIHAHAAGIIHGDLAPANVMLSTVGEIKLTDFTLAQIDRLAAINGGTAGYAAPEQLTGEDVDERADVYGLGALLRALLAPGELSAEREAVDRAVATATAPVAVQRFDSVAEFLAALPPVAPGGTRLSAPSPLGELTRVRPLSPEPARPAPVPGRNSLWTGIVLLAGALLLCGAAVLSRLTVVAAPTTVTLPGVAATRVDSAQLVLRSLGLRTRMVRAYAPAAAGTVLGERPRAGSSVSPRSVVTLVVSRGPRPVDVPALTGLTRQNIGGVLAAHHLRLVVHNEETVWKPAGQVLAQDPEAGALVRPGSAVTVTVAVKPWWWIF